MISPLIALAPDTDLDPMALIKFWYEGAQANDVDNPAVIALATADSHGRSSNRIVRISEFRDTGLVFTTHAGSLKGLQIEQTGWSAGVMYWPEIGQQVIFSGPTYPLPGEDSDRFWDTRPMSTHPMSAVSLQSEPLLDAEQLRQQAAELEKLQKPLPRPPGFTAYQIEPEVVEFWQEDPGRLHHRLKYTHGNSGWRVEQLQP